MSWPEPPEGCPRHPPRLPRPHAVPRLAEPVCALPRGDAGDGRDLPAASGELELFWRDVARRGTPLVGPDPDGSPEHRAVTFLWRGTPATRAVQVVPNKLSDPRDPRAGLAEHAPGTDIWHWTVRLRHDWSGTYDFHVDEGDGPAPDDPAHAAWIRTHRRADPLNPRTLPRRWGGAPVSVARLQAAPDWDDWERRAHAARGTLTEHTVPTQHLGGQRRVWLYAPAGVRPTEDGTAHDGAELPDLPVLVLLDGDHWRQLGIADLLDNLIADGRVPPVAALLPDSVDSATRWADLTCRPAFVRFLDEELIPWAARRLPLAPDPARTILAGQSLGGLTAAYGALTAPHRFGNVLAQSGSFWWPEGFEGADAEWLTGQIAEQPRVPVRFRLAFGTQEWVLLPSARRLRDALATAGYGDGQRGAWYREFNGGHDYACWRTELASGVEELLGGA